MKRTIYEPDEWWKRLKALARKWNVSVSEAIRVMIDKFEND